MSQSLQVRTRDGFRARLSVDGACVELWYAPIFSRRGSRIEVLDYRRVPVDSFDLLHAHPEPEEVLAASREFAGIGEDAIGCAEWVAKHLRYGIFPLEDAVDLLLGSDPLEPVEGGTYAYPDKDGVRSVIGVVGMDEEGVFLTVDGNSVPLTQDEYMALVPVDAAGVEFVTGDE